MGTTRVFHIGMVAVGIAVLLTAWPAPRRVPNQHHQVRSRSTTTTLAGWSPARGGRKPVSG